jgi:pimeloyl-ACP methyl ester carboxylesterase
MQKHTFQHDKLTFSYLDSGGDGPILIALHAHWMEGETFAPLATALAPQWRVVALDQRGHGNSDHAATYTRDDYLSDLTTFLAHLKVKKPVVLLGNSLGGINAYHFAARYPDLVRALIIEDIGVEISVDVNFSLNWGGTFKTREDLVECVGSRLYPCLQDSFRQVDGGWRLAFNPQEIATSVSLTNGNHWKEWLATDCPALLIRGQDSRLTTEAHLEEMALRRPNTVLRVLEGGHVVHADNPIGFTAAVRAFLQELKA